MISHYFIVVLSFYCVLLCAAASNSEDTAESSAAGSENVPWILPGPAPPYLIQPDPNTVFYTAHAPTLFQPEVAAAPATAPVPAPAPGPLAAAAELPLMFVVKKSPSTENSIGAAESELNPQYSQNHQADAALKAHAEAFSTFSATQPQVLQPYPKIPQAKPKPFNPRRIPISAAGYPLRLIKVQRRPPPGVIMLDNLMKIPFKWNTFAENTYKEYYRIKAFNRLQQQQQQQQQQGQHSQHVRVKTAAPSLSSYFLEGLKYGSGGK